MICTYFRSYDIEGPRAPAQMAHLHGTIIVRCNEASETIRDTFPAFFFSQARNSVLNRTITVSLLVRQQLERIDQVLTKSLRDRMRPENFRFICVCAELYHQNPVGCSPFIFSSRDKPPPTVVLLLLVISMSGRDPPNVVLQGKLLQCERIYDKVTPFHRLAQWRKSPRLLVSHSDHGSRSAACGVTDNQKYHA